MAGITIADIGDTYGSLNELERTPGLSGDRRVTTTTEALSAALSKAYTPDSLEGRTTFIGIILISYPTKIPRQGSKQELLYTPTGFPEGSEEPSDTLWPFYDVYKVYIPELECRPLDWSKPAGTPGVNGKMSLQQRVMTFDDMIPSTELLRDKPGPIPAGTLVAVEYEDLTQLKNPRIVGVSPAGPAFDINLKEGEADLISAFNRGSPDGAIGGVFWSHRQAQKTATWNSSDPKYSHLNGTELKNGDLHDIPGFFVKHEGGAKLQIAAAADWAKLASAYKNRFNETLKGGGYRPYDQQEAVRKIRLKGDRACPQPCHGRNGDGTGRGKCNKECKDVGIAAVPGTSPHGWGSAVDLLSTQHKWAFPAVKTVGQVTDEKWKWLNKYGIKYNFVFNVEGEHWHLGWIRIAFLAGGKINASTTRWDPTGVDSGIVAECLDNQAICGPTPGIGENLATTTPRAKTAEELEQESADRENKEFEKEAAATAEQEADQLAIDVRNCLDSALDSQRSSDSSLALVKSVCLHNREMDCADWAKSLSGAAVFSFDGSAVHPTGVDCTGTAAFIKTTNGRYVPTE